MVERGSAEEIVNRTARIAQFISDTRFTDLPESAIQKARLAVLDWLGVAVAGADHPSTRLLFQALQEFSGPEQATALGFASRLDVLSAALLNGYSGHVLDYDDIQLDMLGHPSVPVLPALFALAEWKKKGGRELILAFALGVDVECRVGSAVNPAHYNRGWHSTSTLGHLGAAAACAKLLNLEPERIIHALGIAGTQAGGLRQVFGTMCKPYHPGHAAQNGLWAALLAERGFTSSRDILGGEKGFISAFSDRFDPAPLTQGLGREWRIEQILFKRHASCYRTHAIIECVLSLASRISIPLDQMAMIHCRVPPIALDHAGIGVPNNGLEGKFSQAYCAAVALLEGKAMEQQFSDLKVRDPGILELMSRIKVERDDRLGGAEAVVEIVGRDGAAFSERKDIETAQPPGEKILEDLQEKFNALTASRMETEKRQKLMNAVLGLEGIGNMEEVMALCP